MPKLFDSKNDHIDTLIFMANNRCMIAFHNNKYTKCDLCDDIPEDKIYKCIKCQDVLCKECIIHHLIRTNSLYECEKCDDIFDNKNDLKWTKDNKSSNFYDLCEECIKKM